MDKEAFDAESAVEQIADNQNYYEKPDSDDGYIEGDLAIKLARNKRFKDVIYNDMLGDFNEKGEYVLSEEIMQELIDMPKKIDVITDNGIEARGFLNGKVFHFVVTPATKEENGNAYCFLVLHEEIERMGGYYIDTNSVVVATYDYKYDKFYEQRVREVFHLKEYDSDNDTGEEGKQYFADNITARLAELAVIREKSAEISEKLEELYFNHRIQLLGMGPETALIMAEFTSKRNKLEPFFMNTDKKYYFLNQILDDTLENPKCQEVLEKSPVKEQMKALDEKYVAKTEELQAKIKESHAVKQVKKENVTMMIVEKGKPVAEKTAPTQKPGVSKGNSKGKGGKGKGKSKGAGGKSGGDSGNKKGGKDNKKKSIVVPAGLKKEEQQMEIGALFMQNQLPHEPPQQQPNNLVISQIPIENQQHGNGQQPAKSESVEENALDKLQGLVR